MDTGLTLETLLKDFSSGPASIKTVALLDKSTCRTINVKPDYSGFQVSLGVHRSIAPSDFVVARFVKGRWNYQFHAAQDRFRIMSDGSVQGRNIAQCWRLIDVILTKNEPHVSEGCRATNTVLVAR